MQAFTELNGLVMPLDRSNVDTDAIIPMQFLKSISRSGFGAYLFDEWRYQDSGEPGQDCSRRPLQTDFVLNQPRYRGAQILLTRDNFGCGSSREHAVWALHDYGFRCLIAPGFADIFYSNCGKNGILAIKLDAGEIDRLFHEVESEEGYRLKIELARQQITGPDGRVTPFDIAPDLKQRLLQGMDAIGVTLQHSDAIHAYEQRRAREAPWLFPDIG
ncbi:MAG: 3-isopropylmalate dehydratase small subunit [Gammaproteobacteria bacterium]